MATTQATAPQVLPTSLLEAIFGFASTQILVSAVELDIFTHIQQGQNTLEALVQQTTSSVRGLRILLNALVGLNYLERAGSRYVLTPLAATYLSKASSHYLGGMVLHSKQIRPNWDQLTEIVRRGRPMHTVESNDDRGEFFVQFVDALYALNVGAAEVAARALWDGKPPSPCEVLDVGAGSGVWGLAVAKLVPTARVTVADWPIVIENVTKRFAAREGVGDRYEYLPGNFREVDFGELRFDAALLGHVCHSEGAENSQRLFQRVHRALRPGGQIVIAEVVADEQRREAAFPLVFAVNMLVNTEHGDTFTLLEYRQGLEKAGFAGVRTLEAPAPSPLILATKP